MANLCSWILLFISNLLCSSDFLRDWSLCSSVFFCVSKSFIVFSYMSNLRLAASIFYCSYLSLYISLRILLGSFSSSSLLFLYRIFFTRFEQHIDKRFPLTPNSIKVLFFSKISSIIFSIFSEMKLSAARIDFMFSKHSILSKKCNIPDNYVIYFLLSNIILHLFLVKQGIPASATLELLTSSL